MLKVMKALAAAAVLGALICAPLPSSALAAAGSSDVAATATFLRSAQRTLQHEMSAAPRMAAHANAFVNRVARACPQGFAPLPAHPSATQSRVAQAVLAETMLDFALATAVPFEATTRADARAISGLRWSSARLTAAVARYAAGERASLQAPGDPCPDITAAAADRFFVMPPTAQRLLHTRGTGAKAPDLGTLLRLMTPTASLAERGRIAKLRALNTRLQHRLAVALTGPAFRLMLVLIAGPALSS